MLAKNKKLSHNVDSEDEEFKLFSGTEPQPENPEDLPEGESLTRFNLPGEVMDMLSIDPELLSRVQEHVTRRFEVELHLRQAEFLEAARKEAHAEGFRQGVEKGMADVQKISRRLDEACQLVVTEKVRMLHSHERAWCEAMLHLLKRFICPKPEVLVSLLQAWVQDSLAGFSEKGSIQVYLSAVEYSQVREAWPQAAGRRWELAVDAALSRGEVRIECEGGGIFFSPDGELKILEGYLNGLMETES